MGIPRHDGLRAVDAQRAEKEMNCIQRTAAASFLEMNRVSLKSAVS
jgi:hypothetical protein